MVEEGQACASALAPGAVDTVNIFEFPWGEVWTCSCVMVPNSTLRA